MEATLEKRIVNLEQQFLLAVLSDDDEALEDFSREQSQFSNHIKALKASRALDDKTALLTSYLAGSIENVANCALHVEALFQDAQYHLNDLIREIPPNAHETLSHSPPTMPYHVLFSHHLSPVQTTLGQNKSLDAYAYRWLMQNLHNPYPTSIQFQVLGDLSGTSVAQVELWFEEMRDAIGWTKLSHEYFASSPSATVAAARRVYLERDKDVPFGVVFAFTAVRVSAETHFLKHPALQEKDLNEDYDLLSGMLKAQGRYAGPEGVFVPFPVDPSTPFYNPLYVSDDDESEEEEEDTTPPPAVAGCKRRLTDDVVTSEDSNLVRPPKKHRIRAEIEGTLSNQERTPPALSNPDPLLECNGTHDTEPTSVDMSPTHTSSDSSLHPISSSHSYDTSICHKRGRAELDEDSSDNFVSRDHVPPRPVQRRKVMESASPVPSKGVYSPPAVHGNHPPLGPSPPSGDPSSHPSPPSVAQPLSAVSSNTGIIECNSIPLPPKDAAWMSMPACIDVPNPDFLALNHRLSHVPDPEQRLAEGIVTLEGSNLARPLKRMRPVIECSLSKQECAPLALSSPGLLVERNSAQATEPISVDISPTHTLSDSSLHHTSSPHSYDMVTFICHKRGRAEFDLLDNFISCDDALQRPVQRRKVMESASPVPSKGVYSPSAVLANHPSLDPSPPSGDPSLPLSHSVMELVSAGAGASPNTDIIDCNFIPSPPKDAAWISLPAFIDVSNSDFLESNPQLPHVPDLEYHSTAGSNPFYSLGDWPSLGEPSYLSSSPISSSSSASLYSETPSTSQVVNWSDLTKFIDPVFPTPSQSSSQTSLSTPPSTLPNPQEDSLLIPLPPSCGLNQLGSLLDPSTPPGALLPIQPDVFAEDMHLWPLLYWVS